MGSCTQKVYIFVSHLCLQRFSTYRRPKDYKEIFNLRHAQARNVIERIFGVLKKRFRVIVSAPAYDCSFQARLIQALIAIHNFIRIHDPSDEPNPDAEDPAQDGGEDAGRAGELQKHISVVERNRAAARRDQIAKAMWQDYKRAKRAKRARQTRVVHHRS
jgi:hypothetical protein